LNAKKLERSER